MDGMTDAEYIEWLQFQINKLSEALAEKRSDISDILYDIVFADEAVDVSRIEHRFISGEIKIPGRELIMVEYDTLTTHIDWSVNGVDWKTVENEQYLD